MDSTRWGALPAALGERPTAGVVGREKELEAVVTAARSAFRGDAVTRTFLLTGEAGIGKTTVTAEVARRLHDDGATVLYGRCLEDLPVPYLPVAEAFDSFIASAPATTFDVIDPETLVELSRMVTGVSTRWPHLPKPKATDPETERYLLFRAIATMLTDLSQLGPVVVVIEDVHWADTSTIRLLRHLSDALSQAPVVSLVTGRHLDAISGGAIDRELTELLAEGVLARFHLEGFDDRRMVSLLEHLAGHAMDADGVNLARQLSAETGGNPFFATAILQHLADTEVIRPESGRWSSTVDIDTIALPASVRDVIERRVDGLEATVRAALDVAAVCGREFDLARVAHLCGLDEDDMLDRLETACELGLIEEHDTRLERFVFAHALIQQTLYEAQSRTRRARRHRAIAEMLEEDSGVDDVERVAELAHHWAQTGPDGARSALRHATEAGRLALESLAPQDARQWFERAIGLSTSAGEDELGFRLDAQIGLGSAQNQLGDAGYRDTLVHAALEADLAGDVERFIAAVLANHRHLASSIGQVDEERVAMIERAAALASERDPRSHARLLAILAAELTFARSHGRVVGAAMEAEKIARRLDDDETLLWVLNTIFLPMWVPSQAEWVQSATAEALRLAGRVDDPLLSFLAAVNRNSAMISAVDRAGIDQSLALAASLARPISQPFVDWRMQFQACIPTLLDGDMASAEALAEAALDTGVRSGQPDAFTIYGASLLQIRLHQGLIDEIIPMAAQMAREQPGLPAFSATHAMMLGESGQHDEAIALLEIAAESGFHADQYDYVWLTTTTLWADAAASARHQRSAQYLYDQLLPYRGQGISTGPTMSGVVDQYVARLAVLLGRHEEALDAFRTADELLDRLGAHFFRARNQLFWAEALLDRADAKPVDEVRELVDSARSIGERFDCPGIVDRAVTMM